MKGIIQSQIYQLKRDVILWGMFLGMVVLTLIQILDYVLFEETALTGGYFAVRMGEMNTNCVIFLIIAAAYIMGQDFVNKTAYYDVLYGYQRAEVFWGRAIPTLLVTVVMSMILLGLIPALTTVIYGWGTVVALPEFLLRCVLYLFLVFRICCEVILLTVVCRELYQVYIIEGVLYGMGMFLEVKNPYVFAWSATMEVFDFESWDVYHIDGTTEILYESTISGGTIAMIILSSLGMSVLCLLLARKYFVVKDIS